MDGNTPLPAGRRRTLALAVIGCVMVMDILDLTIVNVAIPTLQTRFGASDAAAQWLVAGYASVFAILIASGGRLGDIFGYRRVLMAGLACFIVASVLCGLAPDSNWLVAARLAQGAAAALMLPQISSLVQILYLPHERVAALGMFGILGGAAAAAGPVIGGLLIGADLFGLGWRPIFLINLPVGLLVFVAAAVLLPDKRSKHAPRVDVPGTALVTLLLGALIVPLVQGRQLGWPIWSLASLASVPILLTVTIWYSQARMARDGSALLIPALFQERSFALGLVLIALFQATMAGLLFTLTLVLQNGAGFSAQSVGMVHAPFAIGAALGIGLLSRKALPRLGPRLVSIGAVTMGCALIVINVQLAHSADLAALMPAMGVMGLGMGALSGPLPPIALSEVDIAYAGAASGTMKAVQEAGGALGVAVIGGAYLMLARSEPFRAFAIAEFVELGLLALIAMLALRLPRGLRIFAKGEDAEMPSV